MPREVIVDKIFAYAGGVFQKHKMPRPSSDTRKDKMDALSHIGLVCKTWRNMLLPCHLDDEAMRTLYDEANTKARLPSEAKMNARLCKMFDKAPAVGAALIQIHVDTDMNRCEKLAMFAVKNEHFDVVNHLVTLHPSRQKLLSAVVKCASNKGDTDALQLVLNTALIAKADVANCLARINVRAYEKKGIAELLLGWRMAPCEDCGSGFILNMSHERFFVTKRVRDGNFTVMVLVMVMAREMPAIVVQDAEAVLLKATRKDNALAVSNLLKVPGVRADCMDNKPLKEALARGALRAARSLLNADHDWADIDAIDDNTLVKTAKAHPKAFEMLVKEYHVDPLELLPRIVRRVTDDASDASNYTTVIRLLWRWAFGHMYISHHDYPLEPSYEQAVEQAKKMWNAVDLLHWLFDPVVVRVEVDAMGGDANRMRSCVKKLGELVCEPSLDRRIRRMIADAIHQFAYEM